MFWLRNRFRERYILGKKKYRFACLMLSVVLCSTTIGAISVGAAEVAQLNGDQAKRSVFKQTTNIGGQNSIASNTESNKLIASLTVTVDNLTQKLIQKDQQIEFLQIRNGVLEALQQSPVETGIVEDRLAEVELSTGLASSESAPVAWRNNFWLWGLLAAGLAFLARHRFQAIYQHPNVFSNQGETRFSLAELDVEKNSRNEFVNNNDYSNLSAVHTDMKEYEVEGVTLLELDEEQELEFDSKGTTEVEKVSGDNISDYVIVPNVQVTRGGGGMVGMHSWKRRIDKLLKEREFHQARTILEAARHNEIDDDRYNYERLRLYIKMGEQAEFYKYYYEIEDKIIHFDKPLRDGIGKMIGSLAQKKPSTGKYF